MKKHFTYFLFVFLLALFSVSVGYSAFPVSTEQINLLPTSSSPTVERGIEATVVNKENSSKVTIGKPKKAYNQYLAFTLCFLLGMFGVHRFYLGYPIIGMLQIITFGGCGIWWLVDFVRLSLGNLKPKKGEYKRVIDTDNM